MTRLRGRPRLLYQPANHNDEDAEITCLAEIPLKEAVYGPEAEQWYQAIEAELKSIIKSNTWTRTERPMMAWAAQSGIIVSQFDVTTVYINDVLDEMIFMEIPIFTEETLEEIICKERTNSEIGKRR